MIRLRRRRRPKAVPRQPVFSKFKTGFTYAKGAAWIAKNDPRRCGPFEERVDEHGRQDWVICFRLGGGRFENWTIREVVNEGAEGVESLAWVLTAQFPDEIKAFIRSRLIEAGYMEAPDEDEEF